VGYLQLADSLENSYWHARRLEFFRQPLVQFFEWMRLPGDTLFLVGGILPVVYLALRMFANRNRLGELPAETAVEDLTERPAG
jgi:nitric oxide reductase subunit B